MTYALTFAAGLVVGVLIAPLLMRALLNRIDAGRHAKARAAVRETWIGD